MFFGPMKITGSGLHSPIREKKPLSYLKIFYLLKKAGSFSYTKEKFLLEKTPLGFDIIVVNGHTEKQMLPLIKYKGKTLALLLILSHRPFTDTLCDGA